MARPTNKQREEWLKIQAILKRDATLYTNFEARCERVNARFGDKMFEVYELLDECLLRSNGNDIVEEIGNAINDERIYDEDCSFRIEYPILKSLEDQGNSNIYTIQKTFINEIYRFEGEKKKINKNEAIKALQTIYGEEIQNFSDNFFNMPVISPTKRAPYSCNNALLKIDLTKRDETLALVKNLFDEFEKNPGMIQGLDEYLEIVPPKKLRVILKDHEIFTHKPPKPLSGRLADALFIYDCFKQTLPIGYAVDEINRYWHEVKKPKISNEKFQEDTHSIYLKFAKDLIDNHGFINFIEGV